MSWLPVRDGDRLSKGKAVAAIREEVGKPSAFVRGRGPNARVRGKAEARFKGENK